MLSEATTFLTTPVQVSSLQSHEANYVFVYAAQSLVRCHCCLAKTHGKDTQWHSLTLDTTTSGEERHTLQGQLPSPASKRDIDDSRMPQGLCLFLALCCVS